MKYINKKIEILSKIFGGRHFWIFFVALIMLLNIVVVIKLEKPRYGYDEIIVTEISNQPMPKLLDTIKAEPHPPGFYLLLKLLPTNDPIKTRIGIASIGTCLMLLAILVGKKLDVLKKYNLNVGILLLMISPFWIQHMTTIKQEAITIPFMLLNFIFLIKYFEKKQFKYLLSAHVTFLVLFLFGYINALACFVCLCLVTLHKKSKKELYTLLIVVLFLNIYLLLGGYEQFKENLTRFGWQKNQYASLLALLKVSVGGNLPGIKSLHLSDFLVMGSIILLYMRVKTLDKNNVVEKKALKFSILYLLFGIYVTGIAKPRYISGIVIILFLLIGQEITKIKIKNKVIPIAFLSVYMLNGTGHFIWYTKNIQSYEIQTNKVEAISESKKLGLISNHPLDALVRKKYYIKAPRITPINPFEPYNSLEITRENLSRDGHFEDKTTKEIVENLKSSGFEDFVYIETGFTENYHDSNGKVMEVLNKQCLEKDLGEWKKHYLILFEKCKFN